MPVNPEAIETVAAGQTAYDALVERPDVQPELEALAALLEPNRRRLYRFVEREAAAVSRDQAAEALGISRTLAAFHLDKLVALGLLSTEYRRLSGKTGPGAGRTSKLYRRSRDGVSVSLPHRDHELLARLLAESAASAGQVDVNLEPARDLGHAVGKRARARVGTTATSSLLLACAEAALDGLGFEAFRSAPGEVRLRNCPFDPLAREFTSVVCGIGQSLMRGVAEGIGDDRLQVSREAHPDRCCGVITVAS